MRDAELAASFAIYSAKQRRDREVTPDHILLGCLRAISRYGIAKIGPWSLDLELLGIDWVHEPDGPRPKVAYSQKAADLFDRAAQIAKSASDAGIRITHLLAAFATEDSGLMGELKRTHGITSATWRGAIAAFDSDRSSSVQSDALPEEKTKTHDYLTPEQAAEALSIHVQTMRTYIRSGRVPAFRLAGERSIRILRADLDRVLEPVGGEKKEE